MRHITGLTSLPRASGERIPQEVLVRDQANIVELALSYSGGACLTPDEADHLAKLLMEAATRARVADELPSRQFTSPPWGGGDKEDQIAMARIGHVITDAVPTKKPPKQ